MSKIIATQYMSLDGVIEDPVGIENSGLGNWIGPFARGPEGDRFRDDELRGAAAILLGRRTYEAFAAVWPTVKSDTADRMNALPKHVAPRTIAKPQWNNTSLLGQNLVASVRDLKTKVDGNILIYASATSCHALILTSLIDSSP
jgi:dihydrofolate reductase